MPPPPAHPLGFRPPSQAKVDGAGLGYDHPLRTSQSGARQNEDLRLGTRIKALAVRFQEPRIGQWRFMGMASSRVLLCGLAVILVGMRPAALTRALRQARPDPPRRVLITGHSASPWPKDTGGEVSPIAAAQWFATHGGVWSDIPTTGWSVIDSSQSSTSVQSGSFTLDVWQGPDGTWQVASGKDATC